MSSEEDGDQSEHHTEEDLSSSEESGGKPSGHEEKKDNSDVGIVEEKSANIDENKSDQSKKKKRQCKSRIKKECPVPHCDKTVVHIPRHLVKVHNWSKHQALAAVLRFNLRKKYAFSSSESAVAGNGKKKANADESGKKKCKDYHNERVCPIVGCVAVVQRLPAHLQQVHGFSPQGAKYKSLLKKAFPQPKRPYSVQMIEKRTAKRKGEFESHVPDMAETVRNDEDEDEESRLESFEQTETSSSGNDVVLIDDHDEDSIESTDPEVIVLLAKWLQSPDGGKKDKKTAKQHVAQIKNILPLIDADRRVMSLFDCTLIQSKFVREKYVPQTIKSYLMSPRHFYCYVLAERPAIDASTELVTQMMEKVKRWSASYKRSSLKRKWEKMEEDRVELVTPEKGLKKAKLLGMLSFCWES